MKIPQNTKVWAKRFFTIVIGYGGIQTLYSAILFNLLEANQNKQMIYQLAAFTTITIATSLYYIGRRHGRME
jgi:NhaP-type Na+/H+ or K+/H+ antiporter